jgi:hypothetical protein
VADTEDEDKAGYCMAAEKETATIHGKILLTKWEMNKRKEGRGGRRRRRRRN